VDPILITVRPSDVDDSVALGLEQGAKYVIVGPTGIRATFNDTEDGDHVGFLTAPPTGLDSADTREATDVIVEGDGSVHGDWFAGERPVTFEGVIDPRPGGREILAKDGATPLEAGQIMNYRMERLKRATLALRADMTVSWEPSTAPPVQLRARRSGIRFTNRFPKSFALAIKSSDPNIYAAQTKHVGGAVGATTQDATNQGSAGAAPIVTVRGPVRGPITIENTRTGAALIIDLSLATGDVLVADFAVPSIQVNGGNVYDFLVDDPLPDWWNIEPGLNPIRVVGS